MTTRTYLQITPSSDALPAERITDQFEQLHRTLDDGVIEILLTTDGEEVAYYLGSDASNRDALRRVASRLFPDSYAVATQERDPLDDLPETADAIAELHGVGDRHDDWQTRLRPPALSDAPEQHDTALVEDAPTLPLTAVVEGLAAADHPTAYQALLRPKPDWSATAEARVRRLDRERDTVGQRLVGLLLPVEEDIDADGQDRHSPRRAAHRRGDTGSVPGTRIDAILAKSARNCFAVNARVLASGPDAAHRAQDLAATFTAVGGDFYDLRPVVHEQVSDALRHAVETRALREADLTRRLAHRIPFAGNRSPRIVADATTIPHVALLDGAALTEPARRALDALPPERTGLTPPAADVLARYDRGLPIGRPRSRDDTAPDTTVALPPALQPLHTAWFGKTGSGKSTALVRAITENHRITDGADICLLPKGDEMATTLLRTHYATHGDLEDVYYFDCSETLPALSLFDIRDDLAAGVPRTTAVQDVTDHYLELLRTITGPEAFDSAVRSPDVIRYVVKALFDPEYGADAFSHRTLERAVHEFRREGEPPLVSDDDLQAMLAGITENDPQAFTHIMQGVANRVEKVPLDDRLARICNHVAADDTVEFDLTRILNEDALVIIDTGGLRAKSQQSLALLVLSNLWTALRQRHRRHGNAMGATPGVDAAGPSSDGDGDDRPEDAPVTAADPQDTPSDLPLVNLYIEEAADLAVSDLLSDLLAQSRAFGLGVTLAMQFPGQLRETDPEAYSELMNNVSTLITGNVALDTRLQQRLATADLPAEAIGTRLRALSRGEWLVTLPAPFDEPEPQPFVVESLPLPPGHPDAPTDRSPARQAGFRAEYAAVVDRTREQVGLPLGDPGSTAATATTAAAASAPPPGSDRPATRVDSALPTTDRLPTAVRYDEPAHAIVCDTCEARYEPTVDGIRRGVDCCGDATQVDRDTVPVCRVPLTLSERERATTDYTHEQLLFLQAVYAGQQGRFDPLAYDLLLDGMDSLRSDCGLDDSAVDDLLDSGLLRHDTDRPHTLYTVTPAGREVLQEPHRVGDAHGHGVGDVSESSLHTMLVELARQYIAQEFGDDPDSPVAAARSYVDASTANARYDAVGLDADGEVVVAAEAERPNHDRHTAVPADYDKLAAVDPDAAIWVTRTRSEAHDVLDVLNTPAEGPPRVTKEYSANSPPNQWQIDQPGFTELRTARGLLRTVDITPIGETDS